MLSHAPSELLDLFLILPVYLFHLFGPRGQVFFDGVVPLPSTLLNLTVIVFFKLIELGVVPVDHVIGECFVPFSFLEDSFFPEVVGLNILTFFFAGQHFFVYILEKLLELRRGLHPRD